MREMEQMPNATGTQMSVVTTFGGLNRTEGASAGEFTAMENLACYHYPSAGTRRARKRITNYSDPTDLFEWDGHILVVNGGILYYDNVAMSNVSSGKKQFAVVNSKIVIWPDMIMIDLKSGAYSRMDGKTETISGTGKYSSGVLTGELDNKILSNAQIAYFNNGQMYTINGCYVFNTYGSDITKLTYSDGSWITPDATEKGCAWGGTYGSRNFVAASEGDIFLPIVEINSKNTTFSLYYKWWNGSSYSQWSATGYNTMKNGGYYGVLRSVSTNGCMYVDIYKYGESSPLFSSRFSVGDRVSITGTQYGWNDIDMATITAIDDETNSMTLDGSTRALAYRIALAGGHTAGEYNLLASTTTNYFTLEEDTTVRTYILLSDEKTIFEIRDADGNLYAFTQHDKPDSSVTSTYIGKATAFTNDLALTITRVIPDMDFICAKDNRLYGVSNATTNKIVNSTTGESETYTSRCIYVSALGLPERFWDFDGTDADSYQVAVASNGDFTGMCSYGGYMLFWKEDSLYKLYGDYPSAFALYEYNVEGVQSGSERSLQIINEVLYYKGRDGVYAYGGSTPSLISYNLGYQKYTKAVAGADGIHYHISMADATGANFETYVYDTIHQIWTQEDGGEVAAYTLVDGTLYAIIDGHLWFLETTENSGAIKLASTTIAFDDAVKWYAEFPAVWDAGFSHRDYRRIRIRLELGEKEHGAYPTVAVMTSIDGGEFKTHTTITGTGRKVVEVPLPLSRAEQVTVRLEGSGQCCIKAIAQEYIEGSATF